ncbi:MAG TPA: sigma-70 family RNA polymerase sigma factor [Anaerolineales bacterium]|nr:sigma-70 family RNA polymerase sigma factor [Anaerolineales bacterium]
MNETDMLNGLRNLDNKTIGNIYDRFFPEIHRYVLYRINDDSVAEDIASDVFVRLLEASQKNQEPRTNLKGWLIATASNTVNDHLRRQYRRPTEELSDAILDETPNVQLQVDVREQNRAVRTAYTQLTSEQQDVIALRFGQGYSLEETARYMKKKVNAVKALQFRALAALQRLIGEAGDD